MAELRIYLGRDEKDVPEVFLQRTKTGPFMMEDTLKTASGPDYKRTDLETN